jgi:DNA-directed RNA polymerase III subunit RPC3
MIFFWFIDLSRTYASILSMMYKTLGNLAQRRAAELDKRKQVLERANRTDVRENPELLSERDRKELKELREVLDKIALAEVRTEMNVFVLRDLPGGPPSTAG